jgi:hypothetical protein
MQLPALFKQHGLLIMIAVLGSAAMFLMFRDLQSLKRRISTVDAPAPPPAPPSLADQPAVQQPSVQMMQPVQQQMMPVQQMMQPVQQMMQPVQQMMQPVPQQLAEDMSSSEED